MNRTKKDWETKVSKYFLFQFVPLIHSFLFSEDDEVDGEGDGKE